MNIREEKLTGMVDRSVSRGQSASSVLPADEKELPYYFEDEGLEMGESDVHTRTSDILFYGLKFHCAGRRPYQVFADLNLYFDPEEPSKYVSPDLMVAETSQPIPEELFSYRVGREGPVPVLVGEVLSFRTFQQGDLSHKPALYAELGIAEYILVDVTGRYLPQRLLIKRQQADGTWVDDQDKDGGITSALGFRVLIESDGQVRVLDARTGKRYARPEEAQLEAEARQRAEKRIRALEAQLARSKGKASKTQGKKRPSNRRRKP